MTKDQLIVRVAFLAVMERYNPDTYSRYLEILKNTIKEYRTLERDNIIKKMINSALSAYNAIECIDNDMQERRFKAFMLRYIYNDKPMTCREIARHTFVDVTTVYADINHVFEGLMPLVFGIDGVKMEWLK